MDISSTSLRIAFLTYRGNPYSGGQGIFTYYMTKSLAEAGHKVTVFSGPPYPTVDSKVKLVKVPSLDLYDGRSRFKSLHKAFTSKINFYEFFGNISGLFTEIETFCSRLPQYLNPKEFDLVHDNQTLMPQLGYLFDQIPFVATLHHPIYDDLKISLRYAKKCLAKPLLRRWYSFVDKQLKFIPKIPNLYTISKHSAKVYAKYSEVDKSAIPIVYSGIDTDTFKPLGDTDKNLIVSCASADIPMKGMSWLLRACKQILQRHPNMRLLCLTKPSEQGRTLKQVADLGLKSVVEFRSGLTRDEVAQCFAKAKIAVIPSINEGFGFAVAEAMACGTPAVAFKGTAVEEIVGVGSPHLVNFSNQSELVDLCVQLLNLEDEKYSLMSQQKRQRVLDMFNWEQTVEDLQPIYANAIKKFEAAN